MQKFGKRSHADNSRRDALSLRKEKLEAEIRYSEQRIRILKHQESEALRKKRTHRLIVRGAMLEQFLPEAETITDERAMEILKKVFNLPDVKAIVCEKNGSGAE